MVIRALRLIMRRPSRPAEGGKAGEPRPPAKACLHARISLFVRRPIAIVAVTIANAHQDGIVKAVGHRLVKENDLAGIRCHNPLNSVMYTYYGLAKSPSAKVDDVVKVGSPAVLPRRILILRIRSHTSSSVADQIESQRLRCGCPLSQECRGPRDCQ